MLCISVSLIANDVAVCCNNPSCNSSSAIVALCCAPSAIVADVTGFPDASSPYKFDVRLIIVHHLVTLICFVSYPSLACQFLLLA